MPRIRFRLFDFAGLSFLMCAVAPAEPPAKPEDPKANAGVAAYVGSEAITFQELDAKALKTNMKLAQSLYDARKAALDQVIMEKILAPEAAAKGVTIEKLISDRLAETAKPVTDAEVEAYFNVNTGRMGGKTLDQVSGQIKTFLGSQKEAEARGNLLTQLKEKANVRVTLEVPRIEVPVAANDPFKGSKDAKVTIIEFSDFQ